MTRPASFGLATTPTGVDLAARPASGPVRPDSFDALFAPADALVAPLPVAFLLLELVRPLLHADPAHTGEEYVVRYPNGIAVTVELHGNTKLGLPTVYDFDVYFALRQIARDTGQDDALELSGVALREIGRALGVPKAEQNGAFLRGLGQSLDRWSAFSIVTDFDFSEVDRAAEASAGRARPYLPETLPRRVRPRRHWHYVLQTGLNEDATPNARGERSVVGTIRFDRVWINSVKSVSTAWIDAALHRELRDRYAKRLYQTLLVRALRYATWSEQEPWEVSVTELLREWGVKDTRARTRETVLDKLAALQERGVVGAFDTRRDGRTDHVMRLAPGEKLAEARRHVGVRAGESPAHVRLVWALQQGPWAFSPVEARYWAEQAPSVVLRVLQRMVYLRETGWEPDKSWGGFVKQALRDEYTFDYDERYQAWLGARLRGFRIPVHIDVRRLTPSALAQYAVAGALEASTVTLGGGAVEPDTQAQPPQAVALDPVDAVAPEAFEDTAWGRARRRLAAELPSAVYQPWIKPLVARTEPTAGRPYLRLDAPDAFAADWVRQKHAPLIATVVGDEVGVPVDIVVDVANASSARHGVGAGGLVFFLV
jgi:hypothetical protein